MKTPQSVRDREQQEKPQLLLRCNFSYLLCMRAGFTDGVLGEDMDDFEVVKKFRRRVVIVQAPAIDGFRRVTRFGSRQATRNIDHSLQKWVLTIKQKIHEVQNLRSRSQPALGTTQPLPRYLGKGSRTSSPDARRDRPRISPRTTIAS